MSMNIYFEAVRNITVNKTGEITTQVLQRDVWQTPTNVTYEIHNSKDPVQAYVDWVLDGAEDFDESVDVYDDDDNVIGRKIVNLSKEHVKEFLEWVETMRNEGYEIRAEIT